MPSHSDTLSSHYHEPGRSAHPARASSRARRIPVVLVPALLALAGSAAIGRGALVEAVPQARGLYAALGLSVARGPLVSHITSRLQEQGQGSVLMVQGEIDNRSAGKAVVPGLRIAVLGSDGRELYHWIAAPPKARLDSGESISFEAKLEDPPADARRVQVRLARPDDDKWLAPAG